MKLCRLWIVKLSRPLILHFFTELVCNLILFGFSKEVSKARSKLLKKRPSQCTLFLCWPPGYCFSASLPPPQVAAAIAALSILGKKPQVVQDLRLRSNFLHDKLHSSSTLTETLHISGDRDSPFQLLQPAHNQQVPTSQPQSIISYINEKVILQNCLSCYFYYHRLLLIQSYVAEGSLWY